MVISETVKMLMLTGVMIISIIIIWTITTLKVDRSIITAVSLTIIQNYQHRDSDKKPGPRYLPF